MKKILYFLFLLPFAMWQCTEVKDWQDPKDDVPPGPVSNPQVENMHGGAKISYTVPADADLLGVKAVYSLHAKDQLRDAYSSATKNYIELEGYGDIEKHTVTLYAIDKSGNESSPVQVSIQPLDSPIDLVRKSLTIKETFGGIYLTWENMYEKDIAITVYTPDETDYMVNRGTYYSTAKNGKTSFRGFEDKNTEFKLEFRDRWNNYSFPLDTVLKPMKEDNIWGRDENNRMIWSFYGWADKSAVYRGDMPKANGGNFEQLTDGVLFGPYMQVVNFAESFFTNPPNGNAHFFPYYFTIDMGKEAAYSRFKYWQGNRNPIGSAVCPSEFTIWGTNNPKAIDVNAGLIANLQYWTSWKNVQGVEVNGTGEWENDWDKLADCKLVYPSGKTGYVEGQMTAEDQQYIRDGFEFEIDPAKTSKFYRYIRFYVKNTTGGQGQFMISEIQFFGQFKK